MNELECVKKQCEIAERQNEYLLDIAEHELQIAINRKQIALLNIEYNDATKALYESSIPGFSGKAILNK